LTLLVTAKICRTVRAGALAAAPQVAILIVGHANEAACAIGVRNTFSAHARATASTRPCTASTRPCTPSAATRGARAGTSTTYRTAGIRYCLPALASAAASQE